MAKKILIDSGHGGRDAGGGSNQHWNEKEFNLIVSLYQAERLKKLGFEVQLTRTTDTYISPKQRSEIVRNSKADLCISNHANAFNGKAFGAEVIYSINDNAILANNIANNIANEGQSIRRVFKKANTKNPQLDYYYMHRCTGNIKTYIIEYGFNDNEKDAQLLIKHWKDYAEAVVKALCSYYGVKYQAPIENVQHWAERPYKALKEMGVDISQTRFNDNITRGEAFALAFKIVDALKK